MRSTRLTRGIAWVTVGELVPGTHAVEGRTLCVPAQMRVMDTGIREDKPACALVWCNLGFLWVKAELLA